MSQTPNERLLALAIQNSNALSNHSLWEEMAQLNITQDDLLPEVQAACEALLTALGIDWKNDHNSQDTPRRLAKMYLKETLVGRYTPPPAVTDFPNASNLDSMIFVAGITIDSLCSHHHQNIRGKCFVGILPDPKGRVMGLSKYARVIDWYARRPQIQEELVVNIADNLQKVLQPRGLAVFIQAEHQCMSCRGVKEHDSVTETTHLLGAMRESPELRDEFLRGVDRYYSNTRR